MAELTEEEKKAKANIERSNKLSMVYRDYEELNKLQQELDSIAPKFEAGKSKAYNDNKYVKPLEAKIKKAKTKLKTNSNAIKNSGDKKLRADYNEFLGKEKGLAKAIGNTKTKTKSKPMATGDNKSNFLKKFPTEYNDDVQELKFLARQGDGKKSDEYKKKEKEINNKLIVYTYHKQKEKETNLSEGIAKARADKNWDEANQLLDQQDAFNEGKIDFSEEIRNSLETNKGLNYKEFDKPFLRTGEKEFDIPFEDLYQNFESNYWKQGVSEAEQVEQEDPTAITGEDLKDKTADGGSGSASSSASASQTTTTGGGGGGGIGEVDNYFGKEDETDYKYEMDKAKKARDEAYGFMRDQDEFVHDYQVEDERDVFGNLIDTGRAIVGAVGASKEVPEYERGQMFSTAMDEATQRRDMGLTPEELAMADRGINEAAAYGMKAVGRGAGGSAGTYLGNVGAITGQMMGAKGDLAVMDAQARRQNRQQFYGMAGQDEMVNRQIFQDELRQTEMSKQAGAGLVQDAIGNMKERSQFNKAYGANSLYGQYMKDRSYDAQQSAFMRDQANKNRLFKYAQDADADYQDAQKAYADNNTLTADPKQTNKVIANNAKAAAKTTTDVSSPATKYNPETGQVEKQSIFKRSEPTDIEGGLETQAEVDTKIAATVKEQAPKKERERYEMLKEASEFGGLGTKAEEDEFKKLQKKYK